MSFYVVNMPAELFMDGYGSLLKAQSETRKLQKDRYLRSALVLLYASLEAELNRQLNIVSYPDPIREIDTKLEKVLTSKQVNLIEQTLLLKEMNFDPDSFRAVRNGIVHFKGDYGLYGITARNIDRYFEFTKTVFEIIHSVSAVAEWINKANLSI